MIGRSRGKGARGGEPLGANTAPPPPQPLEFSPLGTTNNDTNDKGIYYQGLAYLRSIYFVMIFSPRLGAHDIVVAFVARRLFFFFLPRATALAAVSLYHATAAGAGANYPEINVANESITGRRV